MKMPFGKYKGEELGHIQNDDPGYIVWLYQNCKLTGVLANEIKEMYPYCLQDYEKELAEKMIRASRRKAFDKGGGYVDFLGNYCGEDGYDDPNFGWTSYDDYDENY